MTLSQFVGSVVFAPFYVYYHTYRYCMLGIMRIRTMRSDDDLLRVRYQPIHSDIYIDTTDTGITQEIATLAIKEPANTSVIQRILSTEQPETVIDLGANIGDFVLLEHHAHPQGRIIAIEPVSRNRNVLTKNIDHHQLQDVVTIVHAAAAEKDGAVTMRVPAQGNWSSIKKSAYTENAHTEEVAGVRLDTLFAEHSITPEALLIRLDIEGYEHDLFLAHADFLKTLTRTWISLEWHTQLLTPKESVELLECFEQAGFKIQSITNDAPYWVSFFHRTPLYPLLVWAYRKRIANNHIETQETNVPFSTLRNRFESGAYIYAPHITFYKP